MSKKSILSQWLKRKNEAKATTNEPQGRPVGEPAPLSNGQQQLWLLQQLHGDNPFYHYAETYQLQGALDTAKLIAAYRKVVARHEVLRTTFRVNAAGEAQQHIRAEADFELREYAPAAVTDQAVEAICQQEATAAFDLEEGPLSRLVVIKRGETDHLLLFVLHHIITDKWSMRILREELAHFYQADATASLPDLTLQYADFAYQEQQAGHKEKDLAYWQEQLAATPPPMDLPMDKERPVAPSFRGEYVEQRLSESLSADLRLLSKKLDTTLFVLLLSAYKVLLSRYARQQDILVGTPVTNRKKESLEKLIGFFNDTVVLRSVLDPTQSFSDLVAAVKETTLAAFDHDTVSFEQLVKTLNPERHANVNPIFQAMFILHVVPPKPTFGAGLEFEVAPFDLGTTKFDLTLYVSDGEPALRLLFEYATDLFLPETIERMHAQLAVLLAAIAANPTQAIGRLPLLEETAARELHQSALPLPERPTHILTYFDEVVAKQPAQIAVSWGGEQLTYAMLDAKARSVAEALRAEVGGENPIVGLYTDRSLEMMIGMLAILRAGGAYLPLDPDYPAERIQFMLQDAGVTQVLTQRELVGQLPQGGAFSTLLIGEHTSASAAVFDAPAATDRVYMIYTSGSSGKPKGVAVSHANLVASTASRLAYYPSTPGAFLLLSSFSFDSSVAGIFWTLMTGGKLVLTPKRIEQDLEGLAAIIECEQVTHTLLLPSLYETVLSFIETNRLASLHTVIVAGEACSAALTRQHFEQLPDVRFYNEYGPTEATVWATVYEMLPPGQMTNVPIGKAVPGLGARVLNEQLTPQPIGVAGELYLAGPSVTEGYWQRPELTAQRFLTHTNADGTREWLYRTGDLAQYLPDGNLRFLGRVDEQVKFRGFRIELGEIRAGINCFPAVKDSIVVVNREMGRLVAYLYADGEVAEPALSLFLKEQFPSHMVPTLFVPLAEIPRLPNGKVDYKALPVPSLPTRTASCAPEEAAPSNELEATLLKIWEEVLQFEGIHRADNFFEVGGDSILSIQIVAKARKAGIHLAPNAIFNHQTVAELALFATNETIAKSPTVLREAVTKSGLTPIQQWHFETHQQAPHFWNQGLRFSLPEGGDVAALRIATEQLLKEQAALLLSFRQSAGNWEQQVLDKPVAIKTVELAAASKAAQEEAIKSEIIQLQTVAKLEEGGLFQLCWFKCGGVQADQLVLLAHHLVIDAVSWTLLLEQLDSLYGGRTQTAEPVGSSYLQWATQLEDWGKKGKFDAELAFWQQQEMRPLKYDLPGVLPVREHSREVVEVRLGVSATQSLRTEVNQTYQTTTEELLVCALAMTIQEELGLAQLSLGIEHHGREPLDSGLQLDETIGWFTAAFPLRLQLTDTSDLKRTILGVKEQLRAVPNKGIGYGVLRYLKAEQSLAAQAEPPVLLNYLGVERAMGYPSLGTGTFLLDDVRDPKSERSMVWEINCQIRDNELVIAWSYSNELHQQSTIEPLSKKYVACLERLIEHCKAKDDITYSSSDFPDADLSQDDLDNLMSQLDL